MKYFLLNPMPYLVIMLYGSLASASDVRVICFQQDGSQVTRYLRVMEQSLEPVAPAGFNIQGIDLVTSVRDQSKYFELGPCGTPGLSESPALGGSAFLACVSGEVSEIKGGLCLSPLRAKIYVSK